jgi:NACalpha-BTF3-like transcription factor
LKLMYVVLCREKDLAGVKIDAKHVKIIATEFEIDAKTAERRLREHRGDIVAALGSFL